MQICTNRALQTSRAGRAGLLIVKQQMSKAKRKNRMQPIRWQFFIEPYFYAVLAYITKRQAGTGTAQQI